MQCLHKTPADGRSGIEGIPDRNLNYLIGMIIDVQGEESHRYFWADAIGEQALIAAQFLDFMGSIPHFRAYHYGHYDVDALKRMCADFPDAYKEQLDRVLESSTNVLS
ncbi:MAG: hypothetical protein GY851_01550, partial [bacterium]|nr:hypothetical protein [bacterium]